MFKNSTLYTRLNALNIPCRETVPMADYTTMQVGGPAAVVAFVRSAEELITAIKEAKNIGMRYTVIGNGSNTIFSDRGFDGLVIVTTEMKKYSIEGDIIKADCGASITRLAVEAQKAGLTGLEFAYGIPGTLGGAVFMNAGAFGGAMSDVCVQSAYFDPTSGEIKSVHGAEHLFGYRTSIYEKNPHYTVLDATLRLTRGTPDAIDARMKDYLARRKSTQPLEHPSAGSVFKRPEGYFAGKLIEDAGLKGTRVGGAEVSLKHAGFIVNRGGATARDVRALVDLIRARVQDQFGITLECEIRFL